MLDVTGTVACVAGVIRERGIWARESARVEKTLSVFVIHPYLKDSALTAVKRDAGF